MDKFLMISLGVYFMAAMQLINDPSTTAKIMDNKLQVATEFSFDEENEEEKFAATRTNRMELAVQDIRRVVAEIENGIISVEGHDGNNVTIDLKYKVTGRKEKTCEILLDKIDFDSEVDDDELVLKVDSHDKSNYDVRVFMNISIPNDLDVKLVSSKGLLEARNLSGYVDMGIKNGDIACEQINGGIEFYTLNGVAYFKDVKGRISGVAGNGGITCECNTIFPDEISFNTLNGLTRLDFYGTPDARLRAKTGNGRIHVVGIEDSIEENYFEKFQIKLGDGSADYKLNALNGSIRINVFNAE